jgi:uridine phosphorylase
MHNSQVLPLHMNVSEADLKGNGRLGRYVLLPGSDGRAAEIAKHLKNVRVLEHPRRHNFYSGTFVDGAQSIDVGVMSSGMGCPSMDIIASELLSLGAKRLIRVGTAGSLQPKRIRVGSLVVPTATVRDEGTSRHYLDTSIPVLSSLEFLDVVRRVAREKKWEDKVFLGSIHTKDSLYAREFGQGPLHPEHKIYMQHLREAGVLASEMECAQLFTLMQVWNQKQLTAGDQGPNVRCGAVLAIVGDDEPFANGQVVADATNASIELAFACIAGWAKEEDKKWF